MAHSHAFGTFNKTIRRCEHLVDAYSRLREDEDLSELPTDVVRGAVVLGVAALDAYATTAFCEKLNPFLRRWGPNKHLIGLLSDAGLDARVALEMIPMDRPHRRIHTLVRKYYEKKTTHQLSEIDRLFSPYGLKDLTYNGAQKAGRPRAVTSVRRLVDRRNEIAHDGDYNGHNRLRKISPDTVRRQINDLEVLTTHVDEILCNRIPG